MKMTIHDIGYMLAGIAKPWEKDPEVFIKSYWDWNTEYWLSMYFSPMDEIEEDSIIYYRKVYCSYTLTSLNHGPIKERRGILTSLEDFESFIKEVRAIKKGYISID